MPSNVTVAYLADVTDLRTKSALAKSALGEINSEIREQAAAFAELTDEQKGPALAALQKLTAEQKELQSALSRTNSELKKTKEGAEESAGALTVLHEHVKLTGESFEHLSATIGVWTSAASAIGEFALAGLGIERVLESANEFSEAAESIGKFSEATGLTTAQLYGLQHVALMTGTPFETLEGDLTKLTRAMEEAATSANSKAGEAFRAMGVEVTAADGSLRPMGAVLDDVSAKLASYTSGSNKAALELALFGRSGTDLNAVLNELGRDGLDYAADRAKQLGVALDPAAIQAATEYQEHVKSLTEEWQSFRNTVMGAVIPALDAVAHHFASTSLDEQIEKVKASIASMNDYGMNMTSWVDVALSPLNAVPGRIESQMDSLKTQLADLEAQKKKLEEDTAARNKGTFGGDAPKPGSQPAPTPSGGENQVQAWKDQLLQMQGADGQFHAMSASQEAKFWQDKIALTKAGTAAQREVLTEFESASRRALTEGTRAASKATRDEWELYSSGIKEQMAADKGHLDLQISLAQQWLAKAAALYGQDSKQYNEALAAKENLDRESTEKRLAFAREMAEAQASLDKIGEGSDKGEFKASIGLAIDSSALDAKVAAQVQQLRTVLDTELATLQADMKEKLDLGDQVAAASDYKEATAALESFVGKVASLNEQAAQAVQDSWAKIGAPIEGAFSKILGAAVGGGRNTAHAMESAALSVVQSWAKSGIEMAAHWLATQLGMTAASAAGSAARVVAASPEEAAQIAQLAVLLGKHITVEVAKTQATIAGVAVRTAATTAGASAAKVAEAQAGSSTIMAAAGKAAAGAYASAAQVPYIGWILAPVAAAAAFVAVGAYETVASAEGGWGQVPYDGYPAELHRDEMVLPAALASSVRAMAASRSGPALASAATSGGGGSSVTNIGGSSSHSAAFHQENHFHGGVQQSHEELAGQSRRMMHGVLTDWHGNNGTVTLPGRSPRR